MLLSSYPPETKATESRVTITVLVLANLINWLMHGVLTVQLYLYYRTFPNDRTWTKAVVYTIYFLETVHVIGLGMIVLSIIGDGSPYSGTFTYYWTSVDFKWATQALLIDLVGGLVPLIAQCVYAHRIWIITKKKAVSTLITVLAILQLLAAIAVAVTPAFILLMLWLWTGLNVVNDLIIASIMVRSLTKVDFVSKDTRSKIFNLVYLIIATGTLTVTANFLSFILLFLDTNVVGAWISMAILIFMPKLYSNSMLVMLNNRMDIRKSRHQTLDVISTHALSALVIEDRRFGTSDSQTYRDEVTLDAGCVLP